MGPSLLFLEEFWPRILTFQRFSIIIRGGICLYPNMCKIFKEIILYSRKRKKRIFIYLLTAQTRYEYFCVVYMNRMTRIVTSSSIESKVPRFGITIVCILEFYILYFFFRNFNWNNNFIQLTNLPPASIVLIHLFELRSPLEIERNIRNMTLYCYLVVSGNLTSTAYRHQPQCLL